MEKFSIHPIDYLILAVSLIVPIFVSLWFAKKQKNKNNFFKAGGNLPAWAIGISILATLISSVTFLAYPGDGFAPGKSWILLVQGIMVPLTLVFFIWVIVPLYRNVIKLSAYEYFEQRFGFLARIYSSLGFFLAHFAKMGTVFYLIALAFSKMTGIPTSYTIIIIGAIVLFITLIGGMEAVVWLDVIQGLLLILGGIITFSIIIYSIDGGIGKIWEVAKANGKTGFGPYDLDFVNLTFIVMVINGIFYAIQKYGTDQTIVQRYLTAKTDKQAIRASLMGVFLSVPVWALFMFIGTALFVYYNIGIEQLPETITKHEDVFPYFIMTKLPVGIIGLILAALLAAAISSLDSDLNCLSAIFLEDYYLRIKPNTDEKKQMTVSRITIVITCIISVIIGLIYVANESEGILGIIFNLYSIFAGGIAGLFLLGLLFKFTNKKGVYIGMLACILFTAYCILTTKMGKGDNARIILDLGDFNFTHNKKIIGAYSNIVLFVVGFVASLFFKNEKEIDHLTVRGWLRNKNNITH